MNAINVALSEIKFTIPKEILDLAFSDNNPRINSVLSIDERIKNTVLYTRVVRDCNLVAGVYCYVPTRNTRIIQTDLMEYIIEVDKVLTDNRSIIVPLNLMAYVGNNYSTTRDNVSTLVSDMNKMYNNLSNHFIIQTSRLELIGDNIIIVREPSSSIFDCVLKCVVEFDNELSRINPRTIPDFSYMCILAVKSYIYNKLKIKLNQGAIYAGHEIGIIDEIVNEYSEAETMYRELLHEKMAKVLNINDDLNMTTTIKAAIGNMI